MTSYFAPLNLESSKALALDMQSLFLTGRILPFGAQLTVNHVFRCSEKAAVEVVYCFPLPRDASLVSFKICGDQFSIASRLERRANAQAQYEEAIASGSLAALTQQNVDGLVNLTVGNVRPGETVSVSLDLIAAVSLSDDGFRLRFPFTVAPCYQSQMRASLDSPNVGTLEFPDHVTQGLLLPPFHRDAAELHTTGFDLRIEPANIVAEVASPSHGLRLRLNDGGAVGVKLSPDRDLPNRDLVLDVKHNLIAGAAWSDRPAGESKSFVAIVPSTVFGEAQQRASRRIVFLLDRSGSMEGDAIRQARHAIENCLDKLSAEDEFGIVTFDDREEHFQQALVPATINNKDEAVLFLAGIQARGGTELAGGIEAAARLLGASKGEVVVITDGQVAGTVEILRRARRCEIRLFCLGIGSASQDRFLALLSRQTGGVCRFVTPSEQIEAVAAELFAAVGGAVAAEVRVAGNNTQPSSPGPVFAGTPFCAFGEVDIESSAAVVEWSGASATLPLDSIPDGLEGLLEKLRGAKVIADLEARYDSGNESVRQPLLAASERYRLASSEMSLVAVVERPDDKGGHLPITKIVPLGMPHATPFEAMFGFGSALSVDFCLNVDSLSNGRKASRQRVTAESSRAAMARWQPRLPLDGVLFSLTNKVKAWFSRADTLLSCLRDAVTTIENRASFLTDQDVNLRLTDLISELMAHNDDNALSESQQSALNGLVDFLASDVVDFLETGQLDSEKWGAILQQLEALWPELTGAAAASLPGS